MSQTASPDGKFLVELIQRFSHRHLFFLAWFALVAMFVAMMLDFYKKRTRRNFRGPGDRAPRQVRIDARQLAESNASKDLVKKSSEGGTPAAKP